MSELGRRNADRRSTMTKNTSAAAAAAVAGMAGTEGWLRESRSLDDEDRLRRRRRLLRLGKMRMLFAMLVCAAGCSTDADAAAPVAQAAGNNETL